jgi:hypothetical protein
MCQKIDPDEIVISKETGNGFVKDAHGLAWTFHKEPFKSSWETSSDIRAGVDYDLSEHSVRRPRKTLGAEDILASL